MNCPFSNKASVCLLEDKMLSIKLTVFFEDPFWVGVLEKTIENTYSICRVVFGREPTNYEIYNFVQKNHQKLNFHEASKSEPVLPPKIKKLKPKKKQKRAGRESQNQGLGTKAQQALQKQKEFKKIQLIASAKTKRTELHKKKFVIKQLQKKKKMRGK